VTETTGRLAPAAERRQRTAAVTTPSSRGIRHALITAVPLVLLLFAAAALRLVLLDARELFRDEAASWLLARSAWDEIVPRSAAEPYAPVYPFVLKAWMTLASDSAVALRALSALLGVALVGVTWAWARAAFRAPVALAAAALVALSPLAIANARDVRMYALEALWITLAWWLLWRLLVDRRPLSRRPWGIALAALAVAAELWTLPTGVAAFALQAAVIGVLLVTARHSGVMAGATSLIGGLGVFLPGIPRMLSAVQVGQPYWAPPTNLGDLPETFAATFGGALASPAWLALGPLGLLAVIGLWSLLRRGRDGLVTALCLAGGVLLILLWWALSFWRSAYDARYLGAAIPPLAIAIGVGFERVVAVADSAGPWARRAAHALGIAVLVLVASGAATFEANWVEGSGLPPAEAAAIALRERVREGDVVLVADARSYLPLAYATGRSAAPIALTVPVLYWRSGKEPAYQGGDLVVPDATLLPGDRLVPGELPGLATDGSIWLVAITQPDDEVQAFSPLHDGSLIEVERMTVADNDASGWLLRLRPAP
jgi:mannosyltransferase